jgi:hypothetical protein
MSNKDEWMVMNTGTRAAPTLRMNTLSRVVAEGDEIIAWLERRERRKRTRVVDELASSRT